MKSESAAVEPAEMPGTGPKLWAQILSFRGRYVQECRNTYLYRLIVKIIITNNIIYLKYLVVFPYLC